MRSTKSIIEWLGGLAVITSLLLVAYEIRQNTNAISAQAIFDINQKGDDILLLSATDAELARLFRNGDRDPDSLDDDELYRYRYYVWVNLNMYEAVAAFHQKGIISDEEYRPWLVEYCVTTSQAGFQRFISTIAPIRVASFRQDADKFCKSDEMPQVRPYE